MVPLGKGNPISSGNLDTQVFLTEKPPPLSFSEGGGSMSPYSGFLKYTEKYPSIGECCDMIL